MKDYDPKIISKQLIYLDVNNLYGWAMIQKFRNLRFEKRNLSFKKQFGEN